MKLDINILKEVTGEIPSGSSTSFSLNHAPADNSLRLFRGGARITPSIDYTLSGTSLTLATALAMGEILLADYSYEAI